MMPDAMKTLKALCRSLGPAYTIRTIDLEDVIYRDFGNGFNVEVSGVHAGKPATLYLWFGDKLGTAILIRTVPNVTLYNIGSAMDTLQSYTEELIANGQNTPEALYTLTSEN